MANYDVIVIGGGPCGATAAKILSSSGKRVAVFDKAAFPRPKLCGGLLTEKSIHRLQHTFGLTPEKLQQEKVLNYSTNRYAMFHRSRPLAEGSVPGSFHLVNRGKFDALLLAEAQKSGAEIFEDTAITQVSPHKGEVITADGKLFSAKFIIGADGANSIVRRSFNLPSGTWTRNLAAALELHVPAEESPIKADIPKLYIDVIKSGYGWVFPGEKSINIGICGLRRDNGNFAQAFHRYLSLLGIKDVPAFLKKYPLRAHPLPYGNAVSSPVCGRTLLAGDAGGFVETLLGEGLYYAITTGALCAESLLGTADPSQAERRYKKALRSDVLREIYGSRALRFCLFNGIRYFGIKPIRSFIRLTQPLLGDMVQGRRSYCLFQKRDHQELG